MALFGYNKSLLWFWYLVFYAPPLSLKCIFFRKTRLILFGIMFCMPILNPD